MNRFSKIIKAFTLAEVLITLGIIGVVAALTIPLLISSYQEKILVTQFQKVYSQLSQAYISIAQDNGTADKWASSQEAYNYFKPYFKVNEDCPLIVGCFPNKTYYGLRNDTANTENPYSDVEYKFNIADGASFMFAGGTNVIFVDINGKKGPNQWGYDLFLLVLNNKNGAPWVSGATGGMDVTGYCSKINAPAGGWYNGGSCASWLIRKGNMDYLTRNIGSTEWGSY